MKHKTSSSFFLLPVTKNIFSGTGMLALVVVTPLGLGAMQRDGNNTGRTCGLSKLTIGL